MGFQVLTYTISQVQLHFPTSITLNWAASHPHRNSYDIDNIFQRVREDIEFPVENELIFYWFFITLHAPTSSFNGYSLLHVWKHNQEPCTGPNVGLFYTHFEALSMLLSNMSNILNNSEFFENVLKKSRYRLLFTDTWSDFRQSVRKYGMICTCVTSILNVNCV